MSSIILGNCVDILFTMESESVDMIITDPPYGIDYRSNRQGIDRKSSIETRKDTVVRTSYFKEIKNDQSLPYEWLDGAYRLLKEGSAIYIFCHWSMWGELQGHVNNAGFKVKNMLVLKKSNHGMGDLKGSYAPKHELVLFATKGRHILNFPDGREKDVIDVPVKFSGARRLHPNEKPESWYAPFILNSSNEGDTVLDPFFGSGTVGVVCNKLNRKYIGIEIDEAYYNDATQRLGLSGWV